ncbi:MAG: DUF2116 family Zn-ribbon domain-containing protein, partial [Thermoplasmata archaeon]
RKKRVEDDEDDDESPRSKSVKAPAQRIPQHKHCMICHKAIPVKESLCSEECQEEFDRLDRKRRNYMYIMYGLFFVIIIMVILSMSSA